MRRKTFLIIASAIATVVGIFALLFPAVLQESKGTIPNAATYVWTSEVGIILIAIGVMAFMVRGQENTSTLKAFFLGNFIIQVGLFTIELLAYFHRVITRLSGVAPNLIIHILLAFGFGYYLIKMKNENK